MAAIRNRIASGEWPEGFKLPGTSTLMAEFGASESTVLTAMQLLTASRDIESRWGLGQFVPFKGEPGKASGRA
jgi:DNA-binding GntR family transcriptional regulator